MHHDQTQAQPNPMLESLISQKVAEGYQLEYRGADHAILRKPGTDLNNVLHLILSLVTVGLWIPVWILLALLKKREKTITVRHAL